VQERTSSLSVSIQFFQAVQVLSGTRFRSTHILQKCVVALMIFCRPPWIGLGTGQPWNCNRGSVGTAILTPIKVQAVIHDTFCVSCRCQAPSRHGTAQCSTCSCAFWVMSDTDSLRMRIHSESIFRSARWSS